MTDKDRQAMAEVRAIQDPREARLMSASTQDQRRMAELDQAARRVITRAKGLVDDRALPWLLRRAADLAERASRSPKHRPHPVRNAGRVGS